VIKSRYFSGRGQRARESGRHSGSPGRQPGVWSGKDLRAPQGAKEMMKEVLFVQAFSVARFAGSITKHGVEPRADARGY